MNRKKIARRRASEAYDVLLGRPARPDYGTLVVLPLFTAVWGFLIGRYLDAAITRAHRSETADDAEVAGRPETVSV